VIGSGSTLKPTPGPTLVGNTWTAGPIPAVSFTNPPPEAWYETGRMMYEIDRRCALDFAAGILLAELRRWTALVERCDRLEARIKALS